MCFCVHMSKVKEKNCRLCLQFLDDDYNIMEETTREILEVLLLKVYLSITKEPVICKACMESILEAFNFKSACISVDKQVVSLAIDTNSTELDIRDVYLNDDDNKSLFVEEDYNVCRFCLQLKENNTFNPLYDLRGNSANEMVLKCIPELDLNVIKKPLVCAACMNYLESYYNFALKCQITEENILKYREVQGAECNGSISLSNIQKFIFNRIPESVSNCSKSDLLKKENNLLQFKGYTYSDLNNVVVKLEEEEFIIKDENKCGDYNMQVTKCDDIKQKEIVKYNLLTDTDALEKHMLIHEGNSVVPMLNHNDSPDIVIYRCDKCTFETKYKPSLQRHMLIHRDNPKINMYKCNLCNYETKRKDSLKSHMLTHKDSSDVVMYRCERCIHETKYKHSLNKHMLIHKDNSKVTMYKCNLCSYHSKWKSNLKKHKLTHKDSSSVVMYRCEKCTFKTKYKENLNTHIFIHKSNSEVTMYKCDLCKFEARRKDSLKNHMLTHRDSSDVVMHRCERCTYESKYKKNLNMHRLIHKDNSEVTMYKCSLCSYETKRKYSLTTHLLTHKNSSGMVMYRCGMCNYKSQYERNLTHHMLVHKDPS